MHCFCRRIDINVVGVRDDAAGKQRITRGSVTARSVGDASGRVGRSGTRTRTPGSFGRPARNGTACCGYACFGRAAIAASRRSAASVCRSY